MIDCARTLRIADSSPQVHLGFASVGVVKQNLPQSSGRPRYLSIPVGVSARE